TGREGMMPEVRTTSDRLERLGEGDLAALMALRVLLTHSARDGWVPLGVLAERIREEYAQLALEPAADTGAVTPPWALNGHPIGDASEYLREQVVPQLSGAGLVETREAADGTEQARVLPETTGSGFVERLEAEIRERTREMEPDADAPPVRSGSTLAAAGLVKVYRKRRVVNDVALHVAQGEIVGLLGPNGAGKTTTFYMMVGLIAPDAGRVTIGDDDLTSVPMYRRARRGIGYLAQEPSIFRKLTVEENVLAILQMLRLPKHEREERLEALLDELGIKHLRNSKAYALSGGERRRLEITRALVGQPKFMLLDEPFAGVDPIAVHDIQQIVADLRQRDIGVLISDHNVEQTLDIVDRAYIMYDGRVRVSGTVSELVWNDEVAEIYLGPTLTARMRQRYTHPE
ncbi:MAG TPA: LPS export ABC transporter ATP-binding protein, partial [Longimicrobiaceae bacterium]|nr:LPS export ABC transporter ATP-binding protein [Longimicrobiaceae bacterium]